MAVEENSQIAAAVAAGGERRLIGDFPAEAGSVRAARQAVGDFAAEHGADPRCVEDVRLAISEAATNVVMHAYEMNSTAAFRVLAVIGDERLLVVVEDSGCGLKTPARTPGLGAGMRVMHEISEAAMFLERESGGSTVQLSFKLQP